MELERFVEATLRRAGALTERTGGDCVEVVLPESVAAALRLPEASRLRLRGAPEPGEAHAGYGSDLLTGLCSLAEAAGRRYRLELAAALPKRERVERELEGVLSFRNAVGRVESLDEAVLRYLVFDFRYVALSEERHEGTASVAVHVDGGWSPALPEALEGFLAGHPDARSGWSEESEPFDAARHFRTARALALARALEGSRPFIARMERRLQRDTRRVGEYYDSLRREVEERRPARSADPRSLDSRLDAIEAEKRRRLRDLERRYAVALRVEPLSVLALRVRGLRLAARLQRRKSERRACLAWNPLARQFDRWLCDSCSGDAPVPYLCDALHVLCGSCPPDCPRCGSPSCAACRPGGCRCGWRPSGLAGPRPRRPDEPERPS